MHKRIKETKGKIFPTTLKEIGKSIQGIHTQYAIDSTEEPDSIIKDSSSEIKLMCKKHDNLKFTSKWRYLRSDANKNSGHCMVCLAEKGVQHIKIKYLVDEEMQKHPDHPAKIIDERFSKYSRLNTKDKVLVECIKCGDKHTVSINNFFFEGSHQCRKCTKIYREKHGHPRLTLTVENLNKELIPYGFELQDTNQSVYKDNSTLKCPKGHLFELVYASLRKKITKMQSDKYQLEDICTRCSDLALYNKNKVMVEEKGFVMQESFEEYKGVQHTYTFLCKNNSTHVRNCTFSSFSKTEICKECKDERRIEENFIQLKKEVAKIGGRVKNTKPLKSKSEKATCICQEGHEFEISQEKIRSGQWCPECDIGFEERLCRLLFEHIFQANFKKIRPDFLPSPDSDKNLELDGYNKELRIAFEYNGSYWHSSQKAKRRDALKVKLTQEQGIKLIVVHQFKHYHVKELLQIISKLCAQKKIELPSFSDEIDISSAYKGATNKIVLEKLVREKDATFVKDNNNYLGLSKKIRIKCKNLMHPIFEQTPLNMIYHNGWCNECIKEEKESARLGQVKREFRKFVAENNKDIELVLEALEPLNEPSYNYNWRCKRGHSVKANYYTIKRYYTLYKESWCPNCRREAKTLDFIKPSLNKVEGLYNLKYIENESKIGNNIYGFICKNNHHLQLSSARIFTLVKSDKTKITVCKECDNEERLAQIKKIVKEKSESGYLLDTKYLGTKQKYKFSCGVKGHKPFYQYLDKLKKGPSFGCRECTPRTNIKRTEQDKIMLAQSKNNTYTKEKGKVTLLSIKRDTGSTYSDVWSCSNERHKPFILSVDNMNRRDQWCPYCTDRIVKKIPVEGVDYEFKQH